MKQPPDKGKPVLAVCEFKPNAKTVCITLRTFDKIRKSFEQQDAENP